MVKAVHYVDEVKMFCVYSEGTKNSLGGEGTCAYTWYLHRVVCGVASMQKTIGYNIQHSFKCSTV